MPRPGDAIWLVINMRIVGPKDEDSILNFDPEVYVDKPIVVVDINGMGSFKKNNSP